MTEGEMVGWYHQLNGHEIEQAPGDGEGQGSLVCCSPRGCKESVTTEQQEHYLDTKTRQTKYEKIKLQTSEILM